jgi:predicted dehydrogenase
MDDDAINAIAVVVNPEAVTGVISVVTKKNVPIFSEKPPGISLEEATYLSENIKVPNLIAFNRRFIPLNNVFRNIIQNMNEITFIEGSFYRYNRLDETFMIGTGIHWINFFEYLLGPITHAETTRWKNPENLSWLRTSQIIFDSGVKGMMKFFPCSGSVFERVEVHSNTQSIYLEGPMGTFPGRIIMHSKQGEEIITQPKPLPAEVVRVGIVGEYRAFFNLITQGTHSPSTFQNALNSMRIAEAMEKGIDFSSAS